MGGWYRPGNTAAAREILERSQELLGAHQTGREFLYLLNIRALAEARGKKFEEALRLENLIEQGLGSLEKADWRLMYVNAVNLARLYRYSGDWGLSEEYYQRAFRTTWGVRSESDSIYTNICLALTAHGMGDPDRAFSFWIRAAMHWVACARPEGTHLAHRTGPHTGFAVDGSAESQSL